MKIVGLVGTGEIGSRIGGLLVRAGHRVIGYDRCDEALRAAVRRGIEPVAAGEVARRAGVVITCVTDGAALREVLSGEDGLIGALAPGSTVIDTTSAEPWITTELVPRLAARGIDFLDAPVSGGVPAAEAGRMNFMVGGDARVLERCRSLLGHLGPVVTHVGPTGSGHTIKGINMLALAGSMLATAEVLETGRRSGVTPAALVETLNAGRGASYSTRVHFPRFILPGNYGSGFTFDLMHKDLSIAMGLAARLGFQPIMGQRTWEIYCAAARRGFSGRDNTRVVDLVLRPEAPPSDAQDRDQAVADLVALAEAANMAIATETLLLGVRAGLPAPVVADVVGASSGTSAALETDLREHVLPGTFDTGRTLGGVREGARRGLARALAHAVPAMLGATAVQLYALAESEHGAAADHTRLLDPLEVWTGGRLAAE